MTIKKIDFIIYALIITELLILNNAPVITSSVQKYAITFIQTIFPSLFPTMLIGNLLIKMGVTRIVPKFLKNIFAKTFNFNETCTIIFILSFIAGSPSNAKFINDYYELGKLSKKQAENLMCVTHFINPLFVIQVIGNHIFNNKNVGYLLVLMILIMNLIKAFILKNNFIDSKYKNKENYENISFIKTITPSIKGTIESLLIIFGTVITFGTLCTLIVHIFNLNSFSSLIVGGILEMTSGVTNLNIVNISPLLKLYLSYFFINFGGLCIQMQELSMLKKINIKYFTYFMFRIF